MELPDSPVLQPQPSHAGGQVVPSQEARVGVPRQAARWRALSLLQEEQGARPPLPQRALAMREEARLRQEEEEEEAGARLSSQPPGLRALPPRQPRESRQRPRRSSCLRCPAPGARGRPSPAEGTARDRGMTCSAGKQARTPHLANTLQNGAPGAQHAHLAPQRELHVSEVRALRQACLSCSVDKGLKPDTGHLDLRCCAGNNDRAVLVCHNFHSKL